MDTLRFNLRLANYDASENEMFKVLKLANLSVVNNEPVSLDTHLINRGNNYSGGQKTTNFVSATVFEKTCNNYY
ncbi:ABC-type transport system involved in cytochrome bd biosynthesis, fused ATPase and permease components [Escherichia coli]|uniref:ABC-type transport system involved in cytochrome bd biosynthesis, fused ATPase and permease components n=1 Tax=Escherichia coli TaxID=562 RepID=A0A376ZVJ0_ECOLX|nr:ABC-type transport system involved in cytochrome bd biosynthesis, fused ATPase and permease components [Escherichia coli]